MKAKKGSRKTLIPLLICLVILGAAVLAAINKVCERNQDLVLRGKFTTEFFSAEEAAKKIPDGLFWILTDREGREFDFDAFCDEHPNCLEAFRIKGIALPLNQNRTPAGAIDWDLVFDLIENDGACVGCDPGR